MSRKNTTTATSRLQCAATAKPAAIRKLPKYNGLRVCAYGPLVASRSFLSMWPDAHARTRTPANATAPPSTSEPAVGRANSTYAIPRTKPSGMRIVFATSKASRGEPAQYVAADHEALDLGRPLPDFA